MEKRQKATETTVVCSDWHLERLWYDRKLEALEEQKKDATEKLRGMEKELEQCKGRYERDREDYVKRWGEDVIAHTESVMHIWYKHPDYLDSLVGIAHTREE